MSRRTVASLAAVVLLVALFAVAAALPVPYVTMSPGPTVDVLAERQGEEIVQVDGRRTYPTDGRLELTTVSVTGPDQRLSLVEAVTAWFDSTRAVYPRDLVYDPQASAEEVETRSTVQMASSQDTAVAAALRELGMEVPTVTKVLAVGEDSPARGRLRAGDVLLEVNGLEVTDAASVVEGVQRSEVGEAADLVVRRGQRTVRTSVTTRAAEDDPDRAVVGVVVGEGYDFPIDVDLDISEQIGGPSAGLIFSLAVYDTLTPGSLTGGNAVAGTGTITADGRVGPIGGIQQKIVAAADSGAELFLVPAGNCAAALGADVGDEEIRLVRTRTMRDAVQALQAYAEDPAAELPTCAADL